MTTPLPFHHSLSLSPMPAAPAHTDRRTRHTAEAPRAHCRSFSFGARHPARFTALRAHLCFAFVFALVFVFCDTPHKPHTPHGRRATCAIPFIFFRDPTSRALCRHFELTFVLRLLLRWCLFLRRADRRTSRTRHTADAPRAQCRSFLFETRRPALFAGTSSSLLFCVCFCVGVCFCDTPTAAHAAHATWPSRHVRDAVPFISRPDVPRALMALRARFYFRLLLPWCVTPSFLQICITKPKRP